MGGNKPQRLFRGRPLFHYGLEALQACCQTVLVVGLEDLPDDEPGLGPLGGLVTALRRASGDLLVLPVDMPLVEAEHLRRIVGEAGGRPAIAPGNPLVGYYPKRCLLALEDYLAEGGRRAREFSERLKPVVVQLPIEVLRNINTPQDVRDLGG